MQQITGISSSSSLFSLPTTSSSLRTNPPPSSSCRNSTKVRTTVISFSSSSSSFKSSSIKAAMGGEGPRRSSEEEAPKDPKMTDLRSFNKLIIDEVQSGPMPPGRAMELLNDLKRSGLLPNVFTYNTLINSCSLSSSDLEEGVNIYNDMVASNCEPDMQTYDIMISLYGRCGMAIEAEKIFKELRSKGFMPNIVTYNSLIKTIDKSGPMPPGRAMELLNEVKRSGLLPDVMTYNVLIASCSRSYNLEEGVKIYNDMVATDRDLPDLLTYNAMIGLYGRCGMAREAEEMFKELKSERVLPKEAEEVFKELKSKRVMPNDVTYEEVEKLWAKRFMPNDVTYNALLYAFEKVGNVEKVREISEEMAELGIAKK